MSSKAEIEAQIAALQARLRETIEYDPAFTPAELVRWDPSLLGTVLHIQHERNIPANAFKLVMRKVPLPPDSSFTGDSRTVTMDPTYLYGLSDPSLQCRFSGYKRINSDAIMETSGILKFNGIYHMKAVHVTRKYNESGDSYASYFTISNKFDSMTLLSVSPGNEDTDPAERPTAVKYYNLSCKELGMYLNVLDDPYETSKKIYNWILPLANPDRLLLDQIHIATQTHMHGRDIITDKYPLSTLYQEWKRDKTAGRLHRCSPLDEAMITIRALQAELHLARDARAAADAHSEKLRAVLHASAGIKDSENPV